MRNFFLNYKTILAVYILLALAATLQSYFGNPTTFNDLEYTAFNNYIIFKQSFFHLIENKDLFVLHPSEHWDLYKYSPTFALLFAPMAVLPDVVGLLLWNLLNGLVLFFAIKKMPIKNETAKMGMTWFVALELLTSLQNEQSNGLMAGLMIFAFVLLEKDKVWLGCLCIALTVYIKIFGIVAFALFLVSPKKMKFILSSVVWMVVLAALPLLVVSFDQLIFLYESWGEMLSADHAASYGLSVMGWLQTWFGVSISKNVILLLGVALFCLPLVRFKKYKDLDFRIQLLASILIWVVIFNHKAESPTFIIAISGVAIWYFYQTKNKLNFVLLLLAFVFTCLSPTDLFPRALRENIVNPYVLKGVPCIFIWGKLIWEMWTLPISTSEENLILE